MLANFSLSNIFAKTGIAEAIFIVLMSKINYS